MGNELRHYQTLDRRLKKLKAAYEQACNDRSLFVASLCVDFSLKEGREIAERLQINTADVRVACQKHRRDEFERKRYGYRFGNP